MSTVCQCERDESKTKPANCILDAPLLRVIMLTCGVTRLLTYYFFLFAHWFIVQLWFIIISHNNVHSYHTNSRTKKDVSIICEDSDRKTELYVLLAFVWWGHGGFKLSWILVGFELSKLKDSPLAFPILHVALICILWLLIASEPK